MSSSWIVLRLGREADFQCMVRRGSWLRNAVKNCFQVSEAWKDRAVAYVTRTRWLDIVTDVDSKLVWDRSLVRSSQSYHRVVAVVVHRSNQFRYVLDVFIPCEKFLSTRPSSQNSQMPTPEEASTSASTKMTFGELGLIDPLLEALDKINFKTPTEIQSQVLPYALQGRDIIGVAETGSGKTAAFALPILQKIWEEPKGLFAVVLAPTRELAYQISQQFESLGAAMGVRCLVLIGGVDKMPQAVALAKRPHIIVATPGRLNDHLQSTKGFSLRSLKFLVRFTLQYPLRLLIFYRLWTRPIDC